MRWWRSKLRTGNAREDQKPEAKPKSTCTKCGKPATVHVSGAEGSKSFTAHYCEACAPAAIKAEGLKDMKLPDAGKEPTEGFSITTTVHFPASHQLRLYDETLEDLHEHVWKVQVTVAGSLDSIGVVMDFHDLERRLDVVIKPMHGRNLNELPAFAADNPSAENVAKHIGRTLELPAYKRLWSVEVWETPENFATYWRLR